MKKKILISLSILMFLCLGGCQKNEPHTEGTIDNLSYKETEEVSNFIKIEMKSGDLMLLELYPEIAPITVENFQKLVSEKFYDNLTFHRISEGFMIQGGDPNGTGTGGSKDKIKGEFQENGFSNNLKHERGVISMARSKDMNSASSQFFICHKDALSLDGSYAAFGKLLKGYDTLDKLASTKVANDGETPINKPEIRSIRFVKINDNNNEMNISQ